MIPPPTYLEVEVVDRHLTVHGSYKLQLGHVWGWLEGHRVTQLSLRGYGERCGAAVSRAPLAIEGLAPLAIVS